MDSILVEDCVGWRDAGKKAGKIWPKLKPGEIKLIEIKPDPNSNQLLRCRGNGLLICCYPAPGQVAARQETLAPEFSGR